MSRAGAETTVVLAMFWIAIVFGYRKLTETVTNPGTVTKAVPSTAHFIIGWMFLAVILSLVAGAAPAVGGMFAILIAAGDTMINGGPLFADLTGALKATSTAEGG